MTTTQEGSFYREMLAIAIPVSLQSLITSALNTLDTMMISSLGDSAIAGVGLANQVFFFFIMLCFGIATGSAVVISQYFGRGDIHNVRRVNGLATVVATLFGVVFTVIAFGWSKEVMALFIDDALVIEEGAKYLRVVSSTYIASGVSFALGNSLRSTGDPRTPLIASIVGFFLNGFFNYVFIFGVLGFPELGIIGAALGTLIARLAELLIIVYVMRTYSGPLNASVRESLAFDLDFVRNYIQVVWPVVFNEAFWAMGQVMYSVAYAIVGRQATAAVQVAVAIQNIAFVVVRGLGSSCTIMIGNSIGQQDYDKVANYAKKFIFLSLATGGLMGLLLAGTPSITLSLFGQLTPEVYQLAVKLLRVMGLVFVLKALNSVLIVGVLRGGGDTKFSMFVDMSGVWFVGVPLAFIGALWLQLPIHWLVALVSIEEVIKALMGMWRIRSGRWVHELT